MRLAFRMIRKLYLFKKNSKKFNKKKKDKNKISNVNRIFFFFHLLDTVLKKKEK